LVISHSNIPVARNDLPAALSINSGTDPGAMP
jgi:hypothetical protein